MHQNNYATRWRQAVPLPSGIVGTSRAVSRSFFLSVASLLNRSEERSYLRCLYCHNVFDDQKEDFERLIRKLKSVGRFVDTDTCVDMLLGNRAIEGKYFHLSFDDGFRNNFTNAFPILKKHEVPAAFFVPSALINANWNETAHYCLKTAEYNAVIETMKWDDLREMLSAGYEIGSHTRTHARFSAISKDKKLMANEILGSRKELEANLNYECKYISWPFGRLTDADDESLNVVKTAGYTACFGAYRGTVRAESTDIFRIPRHHFEVQWPISHTAYFARGNRELRVPA